MLSLFLFNLTHEKVVRTIPTRQEIETLGKNTLLVYVDDIIIIGNTRLKSNRKNK